MYRHFLSLMELVHCCVLKDIKLYFPEKPSQEWPYSCSKLDFIVDRPLYTIGAFSAIFGLMNENTKVFDPSEINTAIEVSPMHRSAFYKCKKYLVFLDEFSPDSF